jgi:hypothetical protein
MLQLLVMTVWLHGWGRMKDEVIEVGRSSQTQDLVVHQWPLASEVTPLLVALVFTSATLWEWKGTLCPTPSPTPTRLLMHICKIPFWLIGRTQPPC